MLESIEIFSRLHAKAREDPLPLDDSSRLVFLSDCHRGNGGWGDDFAHNRLIYLHALEWYRRNGYTLVEVGDGEELWENTSFAPIHWAYSEIYVRLGYFHSEGRFVLIWGNHNNRWRDSERLRRELMPAMWMYFDGRPSPLLERIEPAELHRIAEGTAEPPDLPVFRPLAAREAVVLRHTPSGGEILVTHGHQGELWSHRMWPMSRFLVRRVWRILQNAGLRPRITPAGNYALMKRVESRLNLWCRVTGIPLIAGHTHQPEFPAPDATPYFNCGSCVHPRCITAIEINEGKITLVKWHVSTPVAEGRAVGPSLEMMRNVLQGPVGLSLYLGRRPDRGRKRKKLRKIEAPVMAQKASATSREASLVEQ